MEMNHEVPVPEKAPVEETAKRKMNLNVNPKVVVGVITGLLVVAAIYFGKGLVIAATVNNEPISRFAVIKELEQQSGKQALTTMINDRLVRDEAEAKNISVSKDEVDAEIKGIEGRLTGEGMTLDSALESEHLTRADLERQITMRRLVEKLLGDKLKVSDEEVDKYLKDNAIALDKGHEQEQKDSIKQQMVNAKLNTEAPVLLNDLMSKANIKYFVDYK